MNEISEDMIHKAAVVISELRESDNGLVLSSYIAEAALEAAGVAEMAARIAELSSMVVDRNSEMAFMVQDKNRQIAELEAASLAYLKAEEAYHAAHIKGEAGLGICQKAAEAEEALAKVLGYKLKSAKSAGGK